MKILVKKNLVPHNSSKGLISYFTHVDIYFHQNDMYPIHYSKDVYKKMYVNCICSMMSVPFVA